MNTGRRSSWKVVEAFHASQYLLIMVVSMAITITFTRMYLELTGYPQIGNDTFHIAHALWGGLFQAIAVILLLTYLNRWIYSFSAILAGMGVGLFIDEIGKFITQTNDYFFPLAAPIIYITIILGVLLYLYIRREDKQDARSEMYLVLDNLKPLLDLQIERKQYQELRIQLAHLAEQTERSDIAQMARGLLQAIPDNVEAIPEHNASPINKIIEWGKMIETKYFSQKVVRRILMAFLLIVGTLTTLEVVVLIGIIVDESFLQEFITNGILLDNPLVDSVTSLNWYLGLMIISITVGILYLIAYIALLRRHENFGTQCAMLGLVLALTVGNTMSFYFNQFSVMVTSIVLFGLLMLVIRYRNRFVPVNPRKV